MVLKQWTAKENHYPIKQKPPATGCNVEKKTPKKPQKTPNYYLYFCVNLNSIRAAVVEQGKLRSFYT